MNPVFEKGEGPGYGNSYDGFFENFLEICNDHLKNKRAKSFAFIIYDFHHDPIKEILNTQGTFTKLDRLSGKDLTIFYINSEEREHIKTFNKIFLGAFEIEDKYKKPLVLFFKINDNEVENIKVIQLEQSDILFTYQELYENIQNYILENKNENIEKIEPTKLSKIYHVVKKVALEKLIEVLIEYGINKVKHS